jgi:hypothetical protein
LNIFIPTTTIEDVIDDINDAGDSYYADYDGLYTAVDWLDNKAYNVFDVDGNAG